MLFLTLATFRETGGIQMVSRTMTKALSNIGRNEGIAFQMLSLCDAKADVDVNCISSQAFKGFHFNKCWFSIYAMWKACSAKTVILAHFNLLPLAYLIKLFSPTTKITMLAHGKEVWGRMPYWKRNLLNHDVSVWAVSTFTKTVLVDKHQITPDRIQVLNNCLDPSFTIPTAFDKPEYLLERYHATQSTKILLTLTRLDSFERDKGYDMVLDCLPSLIQTHPDLLYLIAGKAADAERKRIQSIIQTLKLEQHVMLTGFVPPEELADHHLLSDIFVLPSIKEGFGLVFLEAAACGSDIIAGNRDGSVDALLNGSLGHLVDPYEPAKLAVALKQLLSKPRDPVNQQRKQTLATTAFSFKKYQQTIQSLLSSMQ